MYNEILRKGLILNLYLEQQQWWCERKQYFNLEQQYIGSVKLQNNTFNLTHFRSQFMIKWHNSHRATQLGKFDIRWRVVKGIFVTRDRPFFFPVKCEMGYFFLVNRDFHTSREA